MREPANITCQKDACPGYACACTQKRLDDTVRAMTHFMKMVEHIFLVTGEMCDFDTSTLCKNCNPSSQKK